MNRKLWLLNIVLLAVVVYAGFQFRKEWRDAKAREAATLNRPLRTVAAPKYNPLPDDPPVMATGYEKVAQKMLFHPSRDPTVVVEVPPPPPPKPMPPLPVYHGMMTLGGTTAFLSANATAPHQAIHPGESIGQFKLVDVNSIEMTLEWDGQTIHKKLDELTASAPSEPASPAPDAGRTEATSAAAPQAPFLTGPGAENPDGSKMCVINDGNAEGALKDGYKKVVYTTPFGKSCAWQPAGR